MFFIYGRRTARIKKYTDSQQACLSCKAFDLEVKVYRDYYHLFFIPILPIGDKAIKVKCNNFGAPMRLDAMQMHYENLSRTPFYLYSLSIVLASLVMIGIIGNYSTQKEKAKFVDNPQVGDVYMIRKEANTDFIYYFLRIRSINKDTVFVYHNNIEYSGFVSDFNQDDYFVEGEELVFTKQTLKQMLESAEINSVQRGYGDEEGFNRIR